MSFLAFSVVVACLITPAQGGDHAQRTTFRLTETADLQHSLCKGNAALSIRETNVEIGGVMEVDVRFTNQDSFRSFYNPFFLSCTPQSARLAIFDSNKTYVGDLLGGMGSTRVGPGRNLWVYIPHNSYAGTRLELKAGFLPGRSPGAAVVRMERRLRPGTYYIQMIFHSRFISEPRWNVPGSEDPREEPFDPFAYQRKPIAEAWKRCTDPDLFRSNWVKIELVER